MATSGQWGDSLTFAPVWQVVVVSHPVTGQAWLVHTGRVDQWPVVTTTSTTTDSGLTVVKLTSHTSRRWCCVGRLDSGDIFLPKVDQSSLKRGENVLLSDLKKSKFVLILGQSKLLWGPNLACLGQDNPKWSPLSSLMSSLTYLVIKKHEENFASLNHQLSTTTNLLLLYKPTPTNLHINQQSQTSLLIEDN